VTPIAPHTRDRRFRRARSFPCLSLSLSLSLSLFLSRGRTVYSEALDHHEEPGGAAGPGITTRRSSLLFFFKQSCRSSFSPMTAVRHARASRACMRATPRSGFARLTRPHETILSRAESSRARARAPVRFLSAGVHAFRTSPFTHAAGGCLPRRTGDR